MRRSPTLGLVAAALLVGAALIGCAASAEPDPSAETTPKSTSSSDGTESSSGPTFNAQFSDAGPDSATTTGTTPCSDPGDPGATEPLAFKLPDTDDANNDMITHEGVLVSAADVDMYKLTGIDTNFHELDTRFEAQTEGTQMCVFARCRNATANPVTGCTDGEEATSDIGWKGCCTAGPGRATPKWDCSGIGDDDSADFYIRIKATTAAACLPYSFQYRF